MNCDTARPSERAMFRICQSVRFIRFMATVLLAFLITAASRLNVAGQETVSTSELNELLYQSCLLTGEKSLRLHELSDAKLWLERAPISLRGWEWHYLYSQCDESTARFPLADMQVTSIDLSPKGNQIAVAATDGKVRLFEFPSFRQTDSIGDHKEAVYSVSFSPDGTRLATVARDVTARVWDVATGKELSRIQLDNPGVAETCFSPSGERVATCTWAMTIDQGQRSVKGVVWIWNANSGEVIAKKNVGVKPLDSMQWSDDGTKIVVGSWGGLVHVLDADANEQMTITIPDDGVYNSVISVAISHDGKYAAAGSKDRSARVWRLDDGQLQATMIGHNGFVNAVQFTSDNSRLITSSVDGTNRIWDSASGKELQVLHGHTGSIAAADLTEDSGKLISAGSDKQLRIWDLSADFGGRLAVQIEQKGSYSTIFSPDGTRLYIACFDGHVRVVDTQSGDITHDWASHSASCNTLSLSRDGQRLLTCSWDKSAKLWNTADLSLLATLDAGNGVTHCAISPDGTRAALAVGKHMQIWDVNQNMLIGTCEGAGGGLVDLAFSPDGKSVAVSSEGSPAQIWNVSTQELVGTLGDTSQRASTVIFSNDGRRIATGRPGEVIIWDSSDFQLLHSVDVGDSPVSRLSFSPDCKRLAAGTDAIVMIDVDRGAPLLRFQPNDDTIYYLSFSPDGSRLASCTTGGSVVLSETAPLQIRRVHTLKKTAPANQTQPVTE
ncbi:MAG: hypothetical protein JNL58_02745 [Planctomyces sp.]|nr:hypothetical protein [Planctomyces sp.]